MTRQHIVGGFTGGGIVALALHAPEVGLFLLFAAIVVVVNARMDAFERARLDARRRNLRR